MYRERGIYIYNFIYIYIIYLFIVIVTYIYIYIHIYIYVLVTVILLYHVSNICMIKEIHKKKHTKKKNTCSGTPFEKKENYDKKKLRAVCLFKVLYIYILKENDSKENNRNT